MNIIFLDIDGVLSSEIQYYIRDNIIKSNGLKLDIHCIQCLNTIIADTNAKIVLTSSHRVGMDIYNINQFFSNIDIIGECVGKTDNFRHKLDNTYTTPRGCEIEFWLRTHYYNNYVILDDDEDMLYKHRNNFVRIDPYSGITPNNIIQAKNILNKTNNIL